MDRAYKKWDELAKAEGTQLYQQCPLININRECRNQTYVDILKKFERSHRVLNASAFNTEFGANIR